MKILFFSSYFYPYISGLTTYPWKILNHLAKKHQITILTFNHQENKLKKLKIKNLKLKIIYLPYFFRLSKGFIAPQSLIYFFKEVRQNDLIFLNLPNFEGLPLAIIARLFGKKIISIYHCQVNLGQDVFSKMVVFFLDLSVYIQCLLSNFITGHVDYINNTYIGKTFKNKIKTTFPPIEIFPVSAQFINELKIKKKNEVWIGFVGRIAREKGIEYLINSITRYKLQVTRYTLAFAGPYDKEVSGEKSYYQKIKKMLAEKKINHLFLGNLNKKKLCAFYKIIDVLVLPSINSTEAFGMVQAEAMLLGTPVVTTNLPGVRIPVKLTKMGIIVEPKNPTQLAKAILAILKNKNKYTNPLLVKKAKKIFKPQKIYQFYDNLARHANSNPNEAVK